MRDAIFFWIPKNAGSTIYYNVLSKHGCVYIADDQEKKNKESLSEFNNKGLVSFGHIRVWDLVKEGLIDKDFFDRAYKFCFVRNPWDRAVSLYTYLGKRRKLDLSFESFAEYLDDDGVTPTGLYNVSGLSQANAQLDWITDDDGNIIVDFIGRVENLEEDFKVVQKELGITTPLGTAQNKGVRNAYETYYDEYTKNLISAFYNKDIKQFNYTFKGEDVGK